MVEECYFLKKYRTHATTTLSRTNNQRFVSNFQSTTNVLLQRVDVARGNRKDSVTNSTGRWLLSFELQKKNVFFF